MKLKHAEPAKSVLAITVGFIIVYLVTHLKWALTVAILTGLIGVLSDTLSKYIHIGWTQLAKLLSLIVPNILLTAVFYLFLYPISLLAKLFGSKDQLQLKNNSNTMYKDATAMFDKASLEKPW
jgi:cytochrome c oxidase subunit IV